MSGKMLHSVYFTLSFLFSREPDAKSALGRRQRASAVVPHFTSAWGPFGQGSRREMQLLCTKNT